MSIDGAMSTFGLPPFDISQDFSIPPHLRHNPENFNPRFPNARFHNGISNIFRAGDFASRSVSEDGGRHMNMTNGIEGISEMDENELPISATMNEHYLTSGQRRLVAHNNNTTLYTLRSLHYSPPIFSLTQ